MAVVKESEPFDWIQWLPGMWEVLPFCNPLSLLISQPNVHIQQFCLAGNLNISVSQRLLPWQRRLEGGVVSPVVVFFQLFSHTGNCMKNLYTYEQSYVQCKWDGMQMQSKHVWRSSAPVAHSVCCRCRSRRRSGACISSSSRCCWHTATLTGSAHHTRAALAIVCHNGGLACYLK